VDLVEEDLDADHGGEVFEMFGRALDSEEAVEVVELVEAGGESADGGGERGAVSVGETLGFGAKAELFAGAEASARDFC
jgi:hypothetical protein